MRNIQLSATLTHIHCINIELTKCKQKQGELKYNIDPIQTIKHKTEKSDHGIHIRIWQVTNIVYSFCNFSMIGGKNNIINTYKYTVYILRTIDFQIFPPTRSLYLRNNKKQNTV